eukprot:GEMP01039175.1.p1 GENE.GEMP01039175.1~~GEMP01039175.1.p1  ORF type:complete len:352 (+),score=35.94 GEMP01039175.1:145-1200(+)
MIPRQQRSFSEGDLNSATSINALGVKLPDGCFPNAGSSVHSTVDTLSGTVSLSPGIPLRGYSGLMVDGRGSLPLSVMTRDGSRSLSAGVFWIDLLTLGVPKTLKAFGGRNLILFKTEPQRVHCIDNKCPKCGELLHSGKVEDIPGHGYCIRCPNHIEDLPLFISLVTGKCHKEGSATNIDGCEILVHDVAIVGWRVWVTIDNSSEDVEDLGNSIKDSLAHQYIANCFPLPPFPNDGKDDMLPFSAQRRRASLRDAKIPPIHENKRLRTERWSKDACSVRSDSRSLLSLNFEAKKYEGRNYASMKVLSDSGRMFTEDNREADMDDISCGTAIVNRAFIWLQLFFAGCVEGGH